MQKSHFNRTEIISSIHLICCLEFSTFSDEQRLLLMKYFNEYGMTSTHRRNADIIARCAVEVGTTVSKVKVLSIRAIILLYLLLQ